MAIIVTNPNWVQIDGNRLQKGSRDLHPIKNGVRLTVPGGSDNWDILVNDTTIDGVAVSDSAELMAFFEAQGFRNGGGDGSGVTWDQVTDKPLYTLGTPIQDAEGLIPVYTQNGQLPVGMPEFPENAVPLVLLDVRAPNLEEGNFLVGGEDGNEQKKILPLIEFKRQDLTAVVIGDSHTQDNGASKYVTGNWEYQYGLNGYFTWANAHMHQTFDLISNAGIGGQTSTQIAERFDTDVIALNPSFVFILAGTNDARGSEGESLTISKLKEMYDKALANGITVVALTIYWATNRGASGDASVDRVNDWIKNYGRVNSNIYVLDTDTVLRNNNSLYRDNVHLNSTGAYKVGEALSVLLNKFYKPMKLPIYGDNNLLSDNPFMLGEPEPIDTAGISGTLFPLYGQGSGDGLPLSVEAYENRGTFFTKVQSNYAGPSVSRNVRTGARGVTPPTIEPVMAYSVAKLRIVFNDKQTTESNVLSTDAASTGRVTGQIPIVQNSPWLIFKTIPRPQTRPYVQFGFTSPDSNFELQYKLLALVKTE